MVTASGISLRRITETPVAIVDFETTGLTPGADRVVEVSVVRMNPGETPRLVLDTLVNPMRRMAATEIHGITDADVADAPCFRDIAGEFVEALRDCVVTAYNVYFDIKFMIFELSNIGVDHEPPHFCLMYLRPMLGLGSRCRLEEACRCHGIEYKEGHVAANDALAAGRLMDFYLKAIREQGISTYGQLAKLKSYKFVNSFCNEPFPSATAFNLARCRQLRSRGGCTSGASVEPRRKALASYWDSLRTVLADLEVTDGEIEQINRERTRLGLEEEQIRALHAKAFASAIAQFTDDRWLDEREVRKLRRLHQCLTRLGWAPGQ